MKSNYACIGGVVHIFLICLAVSRPRAEVGHSLFVTDSAAFEIVYPPSLSVFALTPSLRALRFGFGFNAMVD